MLKSRRLRHEENTDLLVSVAIIFEVLWCSLVLFNVSNCFISFSEVNKIAKEKEVQMVIVSD